MRNGEVRGTRIGRETFIHRTELTAWIDARANTPSAKIGPAPKAARKLGAAEILAANGIRPSPNAVRR